MTDEERKEFEEFQKWKDEKKKEESLKHGEAITPSDDGLQIKDKDSKAEENNAHSDKSVEEYLFFPFCFLIHSAVYRRTFCILYFCTFDNYQSDFFYR